MSATLPPMAEKCARCGHPRGDHRPVLDPDRLPCWYAKESQREGAYHGCMCGDFRAKEQP